MRATVLLLITVLLALAGLALVARGTTPQVLLAGGALVLVGAPLLAVARRQLGEAFAVTPQAKGLVMTGLYSRIPHPMYVFLDLTLLGLLIMLRQAWLFAAWAVLVAVQVWQARREARVLEAAFGDAYRAYRTRTWC
jgi:protein-S-isoprenylcysteine O-methyltransferase Ste14